MDFFLKIFRFVEPFGHIPNFGFFWMDFLDFLGFHVIFFKCFFFVLFFLDLF